MSRCTVRGPETPPSSPVGRTRSDSRSSDTERVLSGQCGSGARHRGEVGFEGEARHRVVGLRLQEGGLDPPLERAAASPGIRPRSMRLATSEVMKTVLPDRASPVTPSRMTGSKKVSLTVLAIPSTPRPSVSAIVPITNPGRPFSPCAKPENRHGGGELTAPIGAGPSPGEAPPRDRKAPRRRSRLRRECFARMKQRALVARRDAIG
jgi:hypothetical protein